MPTTSKAFKLSIGGIATLIGILIAIQPYMGLVQRVTANESAIKQNQSKFEQDHDIVIKMSSDLDYIKSDLNEIKASLRQIKNK